MTSIRAMSTVSCSISSKVLVHICSICLWFIFCLISDQLSGKSFTVKHLLAGLLL